MDKVALNVWIITIWTISADGEIVFRVDPLALLSATLRTYQRAACDTDQIVLACPRGTSISIEFAQYNKFMDKDGITINELCPSENITSLVKNATFGYASSNNSNINGTGISNNDGINMNSNATADALSASTSTSASTATEGATSSRTGTRNAPLYENCLWPNALQYSLLQTAVEACQKKKNCKFNATPQLFGAGSSGVGDTSGASSYHSTTARTILAAIDPCPKVRKIVEIAYKCRPYEFRSKVACENDVTHVECNPYSRIAIYSATFGRKEYESIQCPQLKGVREETCLASYATETVMKICHGRRRCILTADENTFGSPCNRNTRMYLKVLYTCVPKKVLIDRYESDVELDEPEDFDGIINDLYDDQYYKESEAIPKLHSNVNQYDSNSRNNKINKLNGNNDNNEFRNSNGSKINISRTSESNINLNPIMTYSTDTKIEDDQQRLYLYILVVGIIGIILCILIIIVRLISQKRQDNNEDCQSTENSPKGNTTIPNGFNDSISEIDTEIDLTATLQVPSVSKNENYITYGPTSSLYGSLCPSNVSHMSTQMLPLTTSSMMCGGTRQSPDIIGVTATYNLDTGLNDGSAAAGGGMSNLGPNNRIATIRDGNGLRNLGMQQSSFGSFSSIGTIVPISSLGKNTTTATAFRVGYIMDPEGILRRPPPLSSMPTTSMASGILTQQQIQSGRHHLHY